MGAQPNTWAMLMMVPSRWASLSRARLASRSARPCCSLSCACSCAHAAASLRRSSEQRCITVCCSSSRVL